MGVHPDKTAIRAVDACGGNYTVAELNSRFAEGHSAALCEAMKAVVDADALTAELLAACQAALGPLGSTGPTPVYEAVLAVIAKATGAA